MNTDEIRLSSFGLWLAIIGSAISVVGVIANNLMLDHLLAMQIWFLSNPILCMWALGTWRHWWEDGLSGFALTVMYAVFTVTNVYGLVI